jgi:hypothetical protein
VAGLLLSAGCTPVRWERPDTDAATQEADIRACHGYAHRAYNTMAYQPLLPPYLVTTRDDKGRLREVPVVPPLYGSGVWPPYASRYALDRLALRREFFEDCLHQKGYRLVPDEGG